MTEKTTVRLELLAESLTTEPAKRALAQAADVLRAGGTVAFPTETVYGLGANALDSQAVAGIFAAKQRPAWDPLIVHISSFAMLDRVTASVSARERRLIAAFWPGPLTLLLPKAPAVPDTITAGRALVGVRVPAHPVARALIAAADVPVAAPSANRFGHTSPTTAQHVLDDLDGRIDLVVDGGPAWRGIESTVIEVGPERVLLYRHGAIPLEEIAAIAGPVVVYQRPGNGGASPESLPSPGVGIRHYAPRATVVPVEVGMELGRRERWLSALARHSDGASPIAVLLPTGWPLPEGFPGQVYEWGNWENDRELAQRLFSGLRALDNPGVDRIVCPLPAGTGLGAALRDRLLKAAREK